MNEGHALGELVVVIDDGSLCDADRGILVEALHDERERQAARPCRALADRQDREFRNRDAVEMQELLRKVFAARQHQAARIAAGVGHAAQLQKARDVLVEERLAVEFLQQVEDDVGVPGLDGVADRREFILDAKRANLVAIGTQRRDDVVFGLPGVDFLFAVPLERVRRNHVGVQQHQDAEPLHTANHWRRDGL